MDPTILQFKKQIDSWLLIKQTPGIATTPQIAQTPQLGQSTKPNTQQSQQQQGTQQCPQGQHQHYGIQDCHPEKQWHKNPNIRHEGTSPDVVANKKNFQVLYNALSVMANNDPYSTIRDMAQGFLDATMKPFVQNPEKMDKEDYKTAIDFLQSRGYGDKIQDLQQEGEEEEEQEAKPKLIVSDKNRNALILHLGSFKYGTKNELEENWAQLTINFLNMGANADLDAISDGLVKLGYNDHLQDLEYEKPSEKKVGQQKHFNIAPTAANMVSILAGLKEARDNYATTAEQKTQLNDAISKIANKKMSYDDASDLMLEMGYEKHLGRLQEAKAEQISFNDAQSALGIAANQYAPGARDGDKIDDFIQSAIEVIEKYDIDLTESDEKYLDDYKNSIVSYANADAYEVNNALQALELVGLEYSIGANGEIEVKPSDKHKQKLAEREIELNETYDCLKEMQGYGYSDKVQERIADLISARDANGKWTKQEAGVAVSLCRNFNKGVKDDPNAKIKKKPETLNSKLTKDPGKYGGYHSTPENNQAMKDAMEEVMANSDDQNLKDIARGVLDAVNYNLKYNPSNPYLTYDTFEDAIRAYDKFKAPKPKSLAEQLNELKDKATGGDKEVLEVLQMVHERYGKFNRTQADLAKRLVDHLSKAGELPSFIDEPITHRDDKEQQVLWHNELDANNHKEGPNETKERIAKDLSKRLYGDPDFDALTSELRARGEFRFYGDNETEQAVARLISVWADTSMDHNPMSAAIQKAAIEEFNLTNYHEREESVETLLQNSPWAKHLEGFKVFLRAQYDHTQEWFQDKGVDHVLLSRGMQMDASSAGAVFGQPGTEQTASGVGEAVLQPLSSFATDIDQSMEWGHPDYGQNGVTLAAWVPVERILGTAQTGFGCKSEQEMVVLGGSEQVRYVVSSMSHPSDSSWLYKSRRYKNAGKILSGRKRRKR